MSRGAMPGWGDEALAGLGRWLSHNQRSIRAVQWVVVGLYLVLLVAPTLGPMPQNVQSIQASVVLVAQFAFWGIWWPFVLLSMILVGRAWCGLFCPEGALTEIVSAHGRGFAMPRWLAWQGWPFVAFACTTIYGQLVSVYQYPRPALVVLGGSTVAAIAIGLAYGRDKRVWCRYLCPVNGVFGLLAKLAPIHFRVDAGMWAAWPRTPGHQPSVNCAPLVPIKTMKGTSACHMCGRCSGYKGAVMLARRSPMHEIVHVAGQHSRPWETVLIVGGLMGLASGAFHWTSSAAYVALKQAIAEWLLAAGCAWPLDTTLPWWALTNYPEQNDVLTVLDGVVLVGYVVGYSAMVAVPTIVCLALGTRLLGNWSADRFHHLAQALIPIAGCGVFLGLSALTVTMLRAQGVELAFVGPLRLALLSAAATWSIALIWSICGLYTSQAGRRLASCLLTTGAVAIGSLSWATLFWPIW